MRPIRLALWSLLVILPLLFTLALLAMAQLDGPMLASSDMGQMTSVMAVAALMLSIVLAPGVVDPELRSFPAWGSVGLAACFAQFVALLFVYGAGPTSVWNAAYIPGIVVVIDLTALILLHVWVACEGFGRSFAVGLGLGGACAGWILCAGRSTEFDAFHAVSAAALGAAFIAGIVIALIDDRPPSRPPN